MVLYTGDGAVAQISLLEMFLKCFFYLCFMFLTFGGNPRHLY